MHVNLHAGNEAVTFDSSLFWDYWNLQTFWTWARAIYATPLPLRPFFLQVDCQVLTMPSYLHASLESLLEIFPLPKGLSDALSNAWTVPGT